MVKLNNILDMHAQPRRVQRHLQEIVDDVTAPLRFEANNMLAVNFWHQNDMQKAVCTFKKTIDLAPHSIEAVWAMRMLSFIYRELGLRAERYSIDMQRLMSLRRMLHFSEEDATIRFATDELRREWDERDLPEGFAVPDENALNDEGTSE